MKAMLFILLIVYLILGISGMVGYYYIEVETYSAAKSQLGWSICWLTLGVATLAFILLYALNRDWLREISNNNLFALIVVMLLLIAGANFGMVRKINDWFGDSKPFLVEGRVVDKWITYTRRKHRVDEFYVLVDSESGLYKFKVKRRNYEMVSKGAFFSKQFRVGYYGIIYRKEP